MMAAVRLKTPKRGRALPSGSEPSFGTDPAAWRSGRLMWPGGEHAGQLALPGCEVWQRVPRVSGVFCNPHD
jgi:hypothetical protein